MVCKYFSVFKTMHHCNLKESAIGMDETANDENTINVVEYNDIPEDLEQNEVSDVPMEVVLSPTMDLVDMEDQIPITVIRLALQGEHANVPSE